MPTPQHALGDAYERWNAGSLNGYREVYDDEIRLHGYSPQPIDKAQVRGFYEGIFRAFDLPKLELARRSRRAMCAPSASRITGRYIADFMGVPTTGIEIALAGITILHFRSDRVIERFFHAAMLSLQVQVDGVPARAMRRRQLRDLLYRAAGRHASGVDLPGLTGAQELRDSGPWCDSSSLGWNVGCGCGRRWSR